MADSLTKSEAIYFLEDVLQIQSTLDKLKADRVSFLNEIIRAFLQRIPFQSVTAIATPKPERRRLTFEEIKACMMTRQGGLCFEVNYFMKVLLENLGYDVHYVACNIMRRQGINHVSTVVKNLRYRGDQHLVEVGSGYPTLAAIPLDFHRESSLYETHFFTHKFVWEADGTLLWMHKVHTYRQVSAADVVDGWYTFMVSDMVPRDIEYFAASMENIRTVESGPEALSFFLVSLRAVDIRNSRLFAIKDTTILEEDSIGQVNKKRVSGPEELLDAYGVYFPQFPKEIVKQAIQTVNLKFES